MVFALENGAYQYFQPVSNPLTTLHDTMTSESSKLDRLPTEILRRIASVATCEAVLASSKVNRTLRAACNDPLVYKAIIDNHNGNGGPRWYHHLPLSMQSPVSSWARYALADSRAAHDRIASLKPTSIVSWAPQLIAYHRQFLSNTTLNCYYSTDFIQIPLSKSPMPWP